METSLVIATGIGILWGRDCVYLDDVSRDGPGTLFLSGTINCRIVRDLKVTIASDEKPFLPFRVWFRQTLGFQMLELDTWESINDDPNALSQSCFEEVVGSRWLSRMEGKKTEKHRHLRLATYDDVFDIVCESFDWRFGAIQGA